MHYESVGKETRCIEDEIPFEIPESWCWVRLGNVAYNVTNKNNQIKTSEIQKVGTHPVVSQGQSLIDGYSNNDDKVFRINTSLTMFGDHTRNVKYIDFDFVVGADGTKFLCPITIDSKFFYYVILNAAINMNSRGYERHFAILRAIYHPLPPLAEQHRIVEKLEAVLENVDSIDAESKKLAVLATQSKSKILDLAIQGKLVPQDPNDEPASVLLERIQKEKEKLVKAGKIKREKAESFIYRDSDNRHYEKTGNQTRCIEDEIPFEIPENWQWVRLKNTVELISGQDMLPEEYNSLHKGVPYITGASCITDGILIENRWIEIPKCISNIGDILITCKGAGVGKMAMNTFERVHIARQIMAIRTSKHCNIHYLKHFMTAMVDLIRTQMNGLIPGISRDVILEMLFPLPPIIEQERIVNKIKQLFDYTDVM